MRLGKFSFGIGDRFNQEGVAQLRAIKKAGENGVDITPVWNKSYREHQIIHSRPAKTREEADAAVKILGWDKPYFVDADHIHFSNVDFFLNHSDFFTLDVAGLIGVQPSKDEIEAFKYSFDQVEKGINIPGIDFSVYMNDKVLEEKAGKFLVAIKEAGKIYRHIESAKGEGNFITEISMDELDTPQTPEDLFFILKMVADENIPVQNIAPKFTGQFNKGVDYVGDTLQFAKEFEQDILMIDYAIKNFGLPENLKLSIHSGSDKFSIYPVMAAIIKKYDKGIHVKTAGTTWIEEVIGLAVSGGEGLAVVKEIYSRALGRKEELCSPYADVIDIDDTQLPTTGEVADWTGKKFADTLRHIPGHLDYNPNFRQLIHVGYKIAAEMGINFTKILKKNNVFAGNCVEENIYERHLKRLFDL